MLPRIKYRNPSIPIEISRHSDPLGPATLKIYTSAQKAAPSSSSNATSTESPAPTTPDHSVDIRMIHESEILAQLVSRTGAEELKATEEEEAELRDIEEFKARSEKDRVDVREKLVKERREQELLRLARGEVAAAA
jgi:large subunit ribosomal protein MRP49